MFKNFGKERIWVRVKAEEYSNWKFMSEAIRDSLLDAVDDIYRTFRAFGEELNEFDAADGWFNFMAIVPKRKKNNILCHLYGDRIAYCTSGVLVQIVSTKNGRFPTMIIES